MERMKFGVELEVATSKRRIEIIRALRNAGINAEPDGYGSAVRYDVWKVQHDGSLGHGWEIVSPPLTDTRELEIVVKVLRNDLKCRATKKTGFHVHHDVSDFNVEQIKNIYRIYDKYEGNAIKSIINPSREYNQYCRNIGCLMGRVENLESTKDFKTMTGSRYHTLNSCAYVKYGTVEFRHHQGTVNLNEIMAWVKLTTAIIETAANTQKVYPRLSANDDDALVEMLGEVGLGEDKQILKQYRKHQRYIRKVLSERAV